MHRHLALLLALALPASAETTFYMARVAPILDKHCVACHGPEKQKGKLRLDSYAAIVKGAESGDVLAAGQAAKSELLRRVRLPASDDEVMPSDGKPLLSANDIKVLQLWIAAGASEAKVPADFPDAPALAQVARPVVPLTADWRPRAAEIATLARAAGVQVLPRSQIATDGLLIRTASSPKACDDAALARLAPIAELIVEAELARTRVTDAGLTTLGGFTQLRRLDLSHTKVSNAGLAAMKSLTRLEALNLTGTQVDDAGVAGLKALPALQQIWTFGSRVAVVDGPAPSAAPAAAVKP
jgi:hypothetical protein